LKTNNKDYIVAIDTDSIMVNMDHIVKHAFRNKEHTTIEVIDFLDKKLSQNHIEPFIEESLQELSEYLNFYTNNISMARDVITSKAVFRKKKNYLMYVWDQEGVRYSEPELKIMGLEAIKSLYPKVSKNALKDCYKIICSGTENELHDYVSTFKDKFFKLNPLEIGSPNSTSTYDDYVDDDYDFIKNQVPKAVRGSKNFNSFLSSRGLDKDYDFIRKGDKVKMIPLYEPNNIGDDVISIIDRYPLELELEKITDYNTQFDKTFIKPLSTILCHVGWTPEFINELDF
jgi:hypothetical protein